MQLNFRIVSIGLLALSILQSGGGNVREQVERQSERSEYKKNLNGALAEKEKEFDNRDALSDLALMRIEARAPMVVDCATRQNVVLTEGMSVCLPNGQPINEGIVATWLLSTGEVYGGQVTGVANIVTKDVEKANSILKKRGGLR